MPTTHLLLILRDLKKNRLVSFLEIFGLAAGMTVGLCLILIVESQFQYDKFHPEPQRTFRIITQVQGPGLRGDYATTPHVLGETIAEYGFVERVVTVRPLWQTNVVRGNETFPVRAAFTSEAFFSVFGFRLMEGQSQALSKPYSVVLSSAAARRFFGRTSPMGQTVELGRLGTFTVTGVIDSVSYRSHIDYDMLLSSASQGAGTHGDGKTGKWDEFDLGYNIITYA